MSLYHQELNAFPPSPDAGLSDAARAGLDHWREIGESEGVFGNLVHPDATIEAAEPEIRRWLGAASDIVVLGIGGMRTGPACFCPPAGGSPRLHWLDTPDPTHADAVFAGLEPARTRVLILSKSGATLEVLTQARAVLERLGSAAGFLAVCAQTHSPLHALAERHGFPVLASAGEIDSRFCVFTLLGLAPLMALGGSADKVRRGGRAILMPLLSGAAAGGFPPAQGACLVAQGAASERTHVMIAGAESLAPLGAWWRQITAESLGKQGRGLLPATARLPADQHGQFQLYLDGPDRHDFTLLASPGGAPGQSGALLEAQNRVAIHQLQAAGRPLRIMRIARVDEESLGALAMHFLLEILLAGRIMGINPFGQPAVEGGKRMLTRLLADQPGEENS